jgi:hypothetical protein
MLPDIDFVPLFMGCSAPSGTSSRGASSWLPEEWDLWKWWRPAPRLCGVLTAAHTLASAPGKIALPRYSFYFIFI